MTELDYTPVIVIGRQFGSGGRRIGKLIADRLGLPYYDKELLSEAAGELGYSSEIFAAADEKRPSPLHSILQSLYGIADNFHTTAMCGEKLYNEQSRVIRKLCSSGGCVIVGRTADYVMRDHPGLVSVFLHSPIEKRAAFIVDRGDAADIDTAHALAVKKDRERENHYNYFTGKKWGYSSNYDLSIDASSLDEEIIADIIIDYARHRGPRENSRNNY